MPLEDICHPVPVQAPEAAAACKPLPPDADDLVAEPSETFAVPRQTILCAVTSDHLGEVIPLSLDRQVPVSLAPVVHRFQRAGEAAFRRDLTNDVLALHRPPSDVGEAEEVECRGRRHPVAPVGAPPTEVYIARLGLMEREPVSTETFAQHVKHSLAAVAVFEGDDKSSRPGESHPEALSEPCVNLSAHTAPPMQPLPTGTRRCPDHRNSPVSGGSVFPDRIGHSLRSGPITGPSSLLRSGPAPVLRIGTLPLVGPPLAVLPWHRSDRFPRSAQY